MSNPFINQDWATAPKAIDPKFDGSLYQKVGLEKELCPLCGAHLKKVDEGSLICLNACHLTSLTKARFHEIMLPLIDFEKAIREVEKREPD